MRRAAKSGGGGLARSFRDSGGMGAPALVAWPACCASDGLACLFRSTTTTEHRHWRRIPVIHRRIPEGPDQQSTHSARSSTRPIAAETRSRTGTGWGPLAAGRAPRRYASSLPEYPLRKPPRPRGAPRTGAERTWVREHRPTGATPKAPPLGLLLGWDPEPEAPRARGGSRTVLLGGTA